MEVRYAPDPVRFERMNTAEIRQHFLIDDLFVPGQIKLVYWHTDRLIIGSVTPTGAPLALEAGRERKLWLAGFGVTVGMTASIVIAMAVATVIPVADTDRTFPIVGVDVASFPCAVSLFLRQLCRLLGFDIKRFTSGAQPDRSLFHSDLGRFTLLFRASRHDNHRYCQHCAKLHDTGSSHIHFCLLLLLRHLNSRMPLPSVSFAGNPKVLSKKQTTLSRPDVATAWS